VSERGGARALVVDTSAGGLGLLVLGNGPAQGEAVPIVAAGGVRQARIAHARRILPGLMRVGLAFLPEPVATERPRSYLAA
jgi:cellulose synthase (UDP-forming)